MSCSGSNALDTDGHCLSDKYVFSHEQRKKKTERMRKIRMVPHKYTTNRKVFQLEKKRERERKENK